MVAGWRLPSTFGGTRYHHEFAEMSELPSIFTMPDGPGWQLADYHPLSLDHILAPSCPAPSGEKLKCRDACLKDLSL